MVGGNHVSVQNITTDLARLRLALFVHFLLLLLLSGTSFLGRILFCFVFHAVHNRSIVFLVHSCFFLAARHRLVSSFRRVSVCVCVWLFSRVKKKK